MHEWQRLRLQAAEFAARVLRYVVDQQRKTLDKNAEKAKAIEDETAKSYQLRYSQLAKKIAEKLQGYGRRGNGLDEPYERLKELVKRGPTTFADIHKVTACIINILDNDGYASFTV